MIDTVVFDVDGVLVDTSRSYTVAVTRAVQWLLVHDAGLLDDGEAVTRDDVRAWREAGGWNNDWDLATGMYRWLRAAAGTSTRAARAAAETPDRAARRSLDELGAGSGAKAARSWFEVQAIFEEIYNGSAVTKTRYRLPTRVGVERGLADEEAVLLRASTVTALRDLGIRKMGIVTGRSDDDWRQVAGRIPLPAGLAVSTDAHGRKPDPLLLKRVLDSLGAKGFVHVGDTVDDVRMVQAYLPRAGSAAGHAVVCCEAERDGVFRALGVTHFVRDVNELPALLVTLRS